MDSFRQDADQGCTVAVCCVKERDALADSKVEDLLQLCIHALLVPPAPEAAGSGNLHLDMQYRMMAILLTHRKLLV